MINRINNILKFDPGAIPEDLSIAPDRRPGPTNLVSTVDKKNKTITLERPPCPDKLTIRYDEIHLIQELLEMGKNIIDEANK
jgi:hypothetical protein